MSEPFLFVYGTLMKRLGHAKHTLLTPHTTYVDEAWIQARLYEINGYPGAVISNHHDDKVHGELYVINNPIIFKELDDYEECSSAFPKPHEYVRKKTIAVRNNNIKTMTYVYIYNWPVNDFKRIKSGYYGTV